MRSSALLLALLLVACGTKGQESTGTETDATTSGSDSDGTTAGPPEGAAVFNEPVEDGNSFTCSTCHAVTEPAPDGFRRPGHPLGDATHRPMYKNGKVPDMLMAVNSCLTEWMNAEPWTEDDQRWKDLYAWLDSQAPAGDAPALMFQIVQPPADVSGGDPDAGREAFNGACAVCHALEGVGTNKAPKIAGLGLESGYVATRVRLSGRMDSPVYDGLGGGLMPFWAADRLSDDELRDIAAWLATEDEPGTTTGTEPTTDPTDATTDPTDPTDPTTDPTTGGDCSATHPSVGYVANLTAFFHDVGGTATIVDDCTIVIEDFTYDGTGIDVRIYGGLGGDYDNGFPMTDDLLLDGGYNGTTLVATVPDGYTLDDLDGISVWCVDVGVDFGSGMFGPP
ncbi:MAG: DM13 domain-containing protein [Myxococcales bacterium]|nr:DM13 domain-containing protein [Myxococcales bacterium]